MSFDWLGWKGNAKHEEIKVEKEKEIKEGQSGWQTRVSCSENILAYAFKYSDIQEVSVLA